MIVYFRNLFGAMGLLRSAQQFTGLASSNAIAGAYHSVGECPEG